MELSIQAALLSVSNLDRSVGFYRDVLGLRPLTQEGRAAVLMIDGVNRQQVLILREVASANPVHMGRGGIGLRLLALEVGTPDELHAIEQRLTERKAFIGRRRTEAWEAIVGIDPDRIELSVSSSLTGVPIQSAHWEHLDQMVYEVGE
jgi:catechol 2,3-dioxygenase